MMGRADRLATIVMGCFVGCGVIALVGAIVFLAGCATVGTAKSQRTVYELRSGFEASLPPVIAYENLPGCGLGIEPCADPALVTKLTAGARAADAALKTAEDVVRKGGDPTAAIGDAVKAVGTFRDLAAQVSK